MRINGELANKLKDAMKNDSYLKSSLEEYITGFSKYDKAAIDERVKQAAEYKKRADEFGGNKVHRYGAAVIDMSRDCIGLSLAWHMEEKAEYINALKKLAAAVCEAPDWVFQGKYDDFDADLRTADIGVNIAIAYNSMKEHFSEAEKYLITNALMEKSVLPIYNEWVNPKTRKHALDTMGHNWWGVIVAGGGAILKILDREPAIHEEMRLGMAEWFNYPGNVLQNKKGNFMDGGFVEFLGYLTYALANAVVWESLGESVLPEDKISGLTDFFITHFYEFDDGIRAANFGDSARVFTGTNMHVLHYLASKYERRDMCQMLRGMGPIGPIPLNYCFYPCFDTSLYAHSVKIKAPTTAIYNRAGQAIVRNGYARESWLFAIRSGESWNHNHLDAGSFILYNNGREVIIDSGNCTYSRDEYHSYYVKPHAHNVVLFNDTGQNAGQMYNGTKFEGNFPSKLFGAGFSYLLADNTGPYANIYQRFYRHVLFLDGVILMIDDLHTYEEGTLSCLFHYAGELSGTAPSFKITNGNALTGLVSLYPQKADITVKTGYREEVKAERPEDMPLPESPYLQINAPTENGRLKFITAFILDPGQDIDISAVYQDNIINVIIKSKNGHTQVLCNEKADGRIMHKNSNFEYGKVSSDGFIICINEDSNGNLKSAAMINGSRLDINGSFFCSSLLKTDCFFDLENSELTAEASAST
ncbi:MAG: heparinase II/III-family protein, partial [Defluviitaleaceae bacterium]|nr:heparinase II/III-family protein [Defluviitaleaceae bacterium]